MKKIYNSFEATRKVNKIVFGRNPNILLSAELVSPESKWYAVYRTDEKQPIHGSGQYWLVNRKTHKVYEFHISRFDSVKDDIKDIKLGRIKNVSKMNSLKSKLIIA